MFVHTFLDLVETARTAGELSPCRVILIHGAHQSPPLPDVLASDRLFQEPRGTPPSPSSARIGVVEIDQFARPCLDQPFCTTASVSFVAW